MWKRKMASWILPRNEKKMPTKLLMKRRKSFMLMKSIFNREWYKDGTNFAWLVELLSFRHRYLEIHPLVASGLLVRSVLTPVSSFSLVVTTHLFPPQLVWLLGNLARATYVGSSDYMWPYSYDQCTEENRHSQEVNACSNVGHYGMEPRVGRGAPEIDVLEAMQGDNSKLPNTHIRRPYVSLSLQVSIRLDDWNHLGPQWAFVLI